MNVINSGYFWVGMGGAVGAIARVSISALLPLSVFNMPLKILCINGLGCFLAGALVEFMTCYWSPSINIKHFLIQGVLGGFTTFSAFAIEFGLLYEKGLYYLAVLYAVMSVLISIFLFFCGLKLVRLCC